MNTKKQENIQPLRGLSKKTIAFLFFCFLVFLLLIATPTAQAGLAQDIRAGQVNLFGNAGFFVSNATAMGDPLALRVGVIVNTLFLLTGIIFLIFTVYSGIQWMMAGGNEETTKKARVRIQRAIIGLVIVVGAWVIVNTVLKAAFGDLIQPGGVYRAGDENAGIELRIQP